MKFATKCPNKCIRRTGVGTPQLRRHRNNAIKVQPVIAILVLADMFSSEAHDLIGGFPSNLAY